jgi:DNA processing protein
MDEPMAGSEEDLESWLRVLHAPGLKPRVARHLLAHFGHPCHLLAAGRDGLRAVLASGATQLTRSLQSPPGPGLRKDLQWCRSSADHHILPLSSPSYPRLLQEIADPPLLLYLRGDPAALNRPQIAVVGSRNPSATGRETAFLFASEFSRQGYTVTSGMALGIDAAAHVGALQAGGYSVAVAATGPDRVYPARHCRLASEIAARGAVISEFPTGTPPRRPHFPQRNRLISGLCRGTLVVEATPGSGSLITARFAAEQGRDVFAVPGSIYSPLAHGCHALIRDGAALAESPRHVLQELAPHQAGEPIHPPDGAPTAPRGPHPVLDHLSHDPATVDDLVRRSGLTAATVSSMLLALELEGLVVSAPGGRYSRSRLS